MAVRPDVVEEELQPFTAPLARDFEIEDALVAGDFGEAVAAGGLIARSLLDRATFTGARLRSLTLTDVLARGVEASGADCSRARVRRVVFERCRLAGMQFADAELEDVVFRECKLTLATFHSARLREVTFEDCDLSEVFLGYGSLRAVRFERCRLLAANFTGATLARVDLRGSELEPAGDVGGLRGATIDEIQLAGLAPLLAEAAGLRIA